jgi:hypothetical protein
MYYLAVVQFRICRFNCASFAIKMLFDFQVTKKYYTRQV